MTCKVLKLFVFDQIQTIIGRNIFYLLVYEVCGLLLLLFFTNFQRIRRPFLLWPNSFLFELCTTRQGKCVASNLLPSCCSRHRLFSSLLLIKFINMELILIGILWNLPWFAFKMHCIRYLPTIITSNVLLVYFRRQYFFLLFQITLSLYGTNTDCLVVICLRILSRNLLNCSRQVAFRRRISQSRPCLFKSHYTSRFSLTDFFI